MSLRRSPVQVTFLPDHRTVTAQTGDTLLDAALDNGIDLPHACGGNCTCTTCHVVIEEGEAFLSPQQAPEDERLETAKERALRSRLACQALLQGGPVVVTIRGDEEDWAVRGGPWTMDHGP
jgi:ferredoxin, 2Fe-2S